MIDLIKTINKGIDYREPVGWPVYNRPDELLDRSAFVTASEIGYCERKIKLDKMKPPAANLDVGYTKTSSSEDWGFFERGHNVEAWAVNHIRNGWEHEEYTPMFMGSEQVSFVEGPQSGTPDAAFIGRNDVIIGEFKSIDPRTNISRLPKLVHVDQVMQNLDLVSSNMNLSPTGGVLLYIDASNYKNRYSFDITWDEAHADRLLQRALRIQNTAPEDLEPEGLFKDDCKYCSHTARCSAMIREKRNGESYDQDLKDASGKFF